MELHSLQSWIFEVTLHDWLWDINGHQESLLHANMRRWGEGSAPYLRNQMQWRLLESNNRLIQDFLAIPDGQIPTLSITSYSKLCYALISQAKVSLALLDVVHSASYDTSRVGGQVPTAQLVVDEAAYTRNCTLLVEKFERASRTLRQGTYSVDAMLRQGVITKSMMLAYSKCLQDKLERITAAPERQVWNSLKQRPELGGPATTSLDDTQATMPRQESREVGGNSDWASLDLDAMDGIVGFDEETWENILNDFMLPLGGKTSLNRPV
jgi:hypothetical protein